MALTLLVIPSFVLAGTPTERLYELDGKFYELVETSNKCIALMKSKNKRSRDIDQCKSAMKIDKADIDRLKNKFNKQLSRYKEKKNKLTERERYWAQKYVLKIKERTQELTKNIKVIYAK